MRFIVLIVALVVAGQLAAAEPTASPTPATAADAPAGPVAAPTPAALQQAFDGAMTCSAVAARRARETPADEAWRWGNRSFAFGMLAAQFYTDLTKKPVTREEMDDFLSSYANALNGMKAEQRLPFEQGCERRYAQMDQLCETNSCPHRPPEAPGTKPAGAK